MFCYGQVNSLDANFAKGYFGQANIHKRRGNYHKAVEFHLKALEIDPDFFQVYYNLGNTEQDYGNCKSAMNHMKNGWKSMLLQHWGKPEEAIRHYKKAVQVNPYFKERHKNL